MKRIAPALMLMTLDLAAGAAGGEQTLQPFTHIAWIPAGSNPSSIRLEKAKMVQIPTTLANATNPECCKEVAFRDPGGSMYCPSVRTGTAATAYALTFSVVDPPLASDYANRYYTFTVYFRPDELAPDVRQAISNGKRSRSDVAGSFKVSTSHETAPEIVIDEAESQLCARNLVDGSWIHSDASCKDDIHYKAISVPSDYMPVKIDASPVRARLAPTNKADTAITRNK